jgi:hypothetical protein
MAGKLTGKIIDYAVTFTVTTIGQAVGMKLYKEVCMIWDSHKILGLV